MTVEPADDAKPVKDSGLSEIVDVEVYIDADVVDRYKALGDDWLARMEAVLREASKTLPVLTIAASLV